MENVIKITKMFLFNLQNSCSIVLLSFIPGRVRVCNVLHFYSQDHFVFKILTFGSTYSARRNHTNLHTNTFLQILYNRLLLGRGEKSNLQPVVRCRVELSTSLLEVSQCPENAPTRVFSLFTINNLLRQVLNTKQA